MVNRIKYENVIINLENPDWHIEADKSAARQVFRVAIDNGLHECVKSAYRSSFDGKFDWCEFIMTVFDFENMPTDDEILECIQEFIVDTKSRFWYE